MCYVCFSVTKSNLLNKNLDTSPLSGCWTVVQALLEAGADSNALDSEGRTPRERAVQSGYNELASRLGRACKKKNGKGGGRVSKATSTAFKRSIPIKKDRFEEGEKGSESSALLIDAFSSLSLHDKCALSLSLSNMDMEQVAQEGKGGSQEKKSPLNRRERSPEVDMAMAMDVKNKESLDVAMSLMGPGELAKLEDEARVIQNNVRAWILRKNYKQLRDTSKFLQSTWREKKAMTQQREQEMSKPGEREVELDDMDVVQPEAPQRNGEVGSDIDVAASTLQMAARRMLARKHFGRFKRQTTASLVIQRHLRLWQKKRNCSQPSNLSMS